MAFTGMSSSAREIQAALVARGVLTYEPSLSAAVYDALYSYWRLPRVEQVALQSGLVAVVSPLTRTSDSTEESHGLVIQVDWSRWLRFVDKSCVDRGVRPTEAAWAFALLVDQALIPTEESRLRLREWRATLAEASKTLAHGNTLATVVSMLTMESGDYYMAFLVGVTVLERALYDLHEQHVTDTGKSTSDSSGRSSTMILRLLLESPTMKRILPPGMLRMLEILFLPSALNLRNLVWHGFVIPTEFPRCFGCLVVLLTLQLLPLFERSASRAPAEKRLFKLGDYNERFTLRSASSEIGVVGPIPHGRNREQLDDLIDEWVIRSNFIPRGRTSLVQRAFTQLLEAGDELWFLFAVLPVLEHALRLEFLGANRGRRQMSDEYGKAQIDEYYSTLDGFGQRDKHQVLLHPEVVVDSLSAVEATQAAGSTTDLPPSDFLTNERRPNALYEQLPSGALAVLLDLFMMHGGPNVRAKLCHGEADLSSFQLRSDDGDEEVKPPSTITQMLLAALVTICEDKSSRSGGSSRSCGQASTIWRSEMLTLPLVSSFHPFYRIYRELRVCYAMCCGFSTLRAACTRFSHEDVTDSSADEALTRLVFGAEANVTLFDGEGFAVLDKTSRVSALLNRGEPASKKSLPYLLATVKQRLQQVEKHIRADFSEHHTAVNNGRCQFLEIVDAERGADETRDFRLMQGDIETDPDAVRRLLALSDGDGLSVTACVLDILTSIQRSMRSFRERVVKLQELIVAGSARTSHRRSFINSVFFLPVLEHVLFVCLSVVEHHIVHVFQAAASSGALESGQLGPPRVGCPRGTAIELLQRKLLQFITAFEGCTGSAEAAQKSIEKALELAVQFFGSKAVTIAVGL